MQCLKCKKKMQTKRTRAETGKVFRERYCRKCRMSLNTTEEPNFVIALKNEEMQERIEKMTDLYEETQREYDNMKETVRDFFSLINKTKA